MTITDIIALILPLLTAAGGWFVGKRKMKAEAAASELENVQQAIKIWRETAEALEEKCDILLVEMEMMRSENKELKLKIQSLERKLNSMNQK